MKPAKNLKGERVGILTVLHDTGKTKYKKPSKVWLCRCDCGNAKEYSTAELLGTVRSCGCLKKKYNDSFGDRNRGVTPTTALEPGESTRRSILSTYRHSAKRRNIPFRLNETEFRNLINQRCFYCNEPPSQTRLDRHRASGNVLYNGIDRRDNTRGYETDNCVPCCKVCNRAKDTMTTEEFYDWVKRVFVRGDLEKRGVTSTVV